MSVARQFKEQVLATMKEDGLHQGCSKSKVSVDSAQAPETGVDEIVLTGSVSTPEEDEEVCVDAATPETETKESVCDGDVETSELSDPVHAPAPQERSLSDLRFQQNFKKILQEVEEFNAEKEVENDIQWREAAALAKEKLDALEAREAKLSPEGKDLVQEYNNCFSL